MCFLFSFQRKRYTSDTKPSTDKPPKATVGSWVSTTDTRKEQSSSAFSDDKKRRTSDDKKDMPASPLLDRKERTISALSDGKKSRSSSLSSEDLKSRTTSAIGSSLLIGSSIVTSPNLTSEGIHDEKKDKYFGDKKVKKTEDKKDKYYDDRKDKYPESKKDKRSDDKKEKHSEDKKRSPFFSRIESSLSSLTKKQDNPGLSRSSSTLSEDSLGSLKDYDIPSDTLASVNQRSHQKLSRLLGQDIPPSDTIPNVSQGDPNKLSKILGHEFAAQFNELKDNIDRNVREDISTSGTPELSTNVPNIKEDVSTLRTREQLPTLGNPDQAMNIPSSFVSSSNFTTVGQTVSDATNTVASTASAASGQNGFHSFQVDFIRNMIEDAMEDNRFVSLYIFLFLVTS